MKLKRTLCFVLVLTMLLSLTATATNGYTPDYDTETPVIIVHGMSQNNTYLLDSNGDRAKDDDGNYITGWPLYLDLKPFIMKILPNALASILFRSDIGLSKTIRNNVKVALPAIHKDTNGNYIKDVEVPCYEMPMSELPEAVKKEYYRFLPIQELGEIIGEDDVYYFGFDSIGDVMHETEKLHDYIHNVVLPASPNGQIKICPISLGGTIAVNYLEAYPEDYKLIKKMVFVEPAIDGSNIIGDLFTGNISVYSDDETLYEYLFVKLLGETPLAYALNMVIRILPDKVLKSALESLVDGLVDTALRPATILWALCPDAYYKEAKEKWLSDDEYASIAEDVDYFMNSRANFTDNLQALMDTGCEIFNLVCYDVPLFPLCKDYRTTNGDHVIHAASTSMGATFAPLGQTLGKGYTAVGTYCDDPSHNHLSPDGVVDATTGLLPCTTWYFKGQAHEMLPDNDVALGLAIRAMTDNNMKSVYSNPAYPQFNTGRLTKIARENIKVWEAADKNGLSSLQIEKVDGAVSRVEELLNETVVDIGAWKDADEALRKALTEVGVIEDTEPGVFEVFLTGILKKLNKKVNSIFARF